MRKILIELQIDWEGYEDVSDELIVEDAIEAKVEGVGWTLLRQPLVSGQVCKHKHIMHINSEIGWLCLDCRKFSDDKQTFR